jgi:FkbM family methyltransferase
MNGSVPASDIADGVAEGLMARVVALRRNYQKEVKRLVDERPFLVFYGCGEVLRRLVPQAWDRYVGREIDFCCDSDPERWGRTYAGLRCISPEDLLAIGDRCTVFVTIGQFKPVLDWLAGTEVASANVIYKYDLASAEFLASQSDRDILDGLLSARRLLADRRSEQVFDAIVARGFGASDDPCVMMDVCEPDQYFPADIVQLTDHEAFVDAGAYDGDTVMDLVERTRGRFDRITCFELDQTNYEALAGTVGTLPGAERIAIHNLGVWDAAAEIKYSADSLQSSVGDGDRTGRVVALDDVLGEERVTYIKMDIEGAELRGLHGAERLIRTQKPRLAICVYHHLKDLWEIPAAIHELVPEYKIYLRHHTNLEYETVCYAIA